VRLVMASLCCANWQPAWRFIQPPATSHPESRRWLGAHHRRWVCPWTKDELADLCLASRDPGFRSGRLKTRWPICSPHFRPCLHLLAGVR
jgi:hypothetical protein